MGDKSLEANHHIERKILYVLVYDVYCIFKVIVPRDDFNFRILQDESSWTMRPLDETRRKTSRDPCLTRGAGMNMLG